MTAQSGRSPINRFDLGPSTRSAKLDRLPACVGRLGAEQLLQPFAAAGGDPGLVVLAPGEMPGPAHGRGEPDLAVGAMLVEQELAARLDLDGQDAAYKFGIEITAPRRLAPRSAPD